MAAFQKESGSVTSRDFSANGWMGRFMAWVVKTYGNGGPGWFMLDDMSAAGSNPYIVVASLSTPTPNQGAKIIRYIMNSTTERIEVEYYMWWDAATHTGVGMWHKGNLTTQTGSFAYDFRGGPEMLFTATWIGSTVDWSYIDEFEAIAKFLEVSTAGGTLVSPAYLEAGDSGNQLSAYWSLTGWATLVDASGKLYFRLTNTTGSTYRIDVFNNAGRTNLVGQSGTYGSTSTGAIGVSGVGDGAGILGGTITRDATSTAVDTIEVTFNRLVLNTGEGANFTVNRYYFLYDFQGLTPRLSYFRVTAISGDTLTVDTLTAGWAFATGARCGSYPHRWVASSQRYWTFATAGVQGIPYVSRQGSEYGAPNGTNDQQGGYSYLNDLGWCAPDDEGTFEMMRPLVREHLNEGGGQTGLNRRYGRTKNIIFTNGVGLQDLVFGRPLDGNNWLCFEGAGSGNIAHLVRDWSSLS